MSILREQDLRQIEQTLYTPKENELVARKILRVNTNYNKFASSVGYHWYSRKGSAKIFASGASAKDVPFVGEDGGEIIAKVYDIITGVRYTFKELEASQMRGTQTNVPSLRLEVTRIETARRVVAETENRLVLVGDANSKIKGLLNMTNINIEDVAQGAFVGTAALKRQFINKTPKEILKDLLRAKTVSRNKGLFNPDTLVLPPDQYDMLDQPYSDTSTMTIRAWLTSQGINFPKVFSARELSAEFNGIGVDCLLVLDSSPEVAEIAVTRDLEIMAPVYDFVGNSEQAILQSTAGATIRHPQAIYVGKGI